MENIYLTRFLCCKEGYSSNNRGGYIRHLVDLVHSYDVASSNNTAIGCDYGSFMCHRMRSKRFTSINDKALSCSNVWGVGNPLFWADYNISILESILIKDRADLLQTYGIAPRNVSLSNVQFNGRTIISAQLTGDFEVDKCKFYPTTSDDTIITVSTSVFNRLKITGNVFY
jgi:hypothetical protein